MKRNFITLAMLFAFGTFLTTQFACQSEEAFNGFSDDNPPSENTPIFGSLNEVFSLYDHPTDSLEFSNSTDATLTGRLGVEIDIAANSCTDENGNPPAEPLQLLLKEYLTLEQMFWGKAPTMSNGQMLVTGGNFWWKVIDANGNDVQVDTYGVSARIPVQTNISGYENLMQYYVGTPTVENDLELVDWQLNAQGEAFVNDDLLFTIFNLNLGWANCDVLYDLASENPTQFSVALNPSNTSATIAQKSVWMFVQDFPSLISIHTPDGDNLATYENSIPVGLNATLVAVATDQDGYLMYGTLPVTVEGDDLFTVEVDYGTSDDLANTISAIQ